MRFLTSTHDVPNTARGSVVSIGNYDGVHRGHLALLERTRRLAEKAGVPSGVLTFEPHPLSLLRPELPPFRVSTSEQKRAWIEAEHIDLLWELPFTDALSQCMGDAFVQECLVDQLAIHTLVVGDDFHFGKNRSGTTQRLAELAAHHGFSLDIVSAVTETHSTLRYSSSAVRRAIAEGDTVHAAAILGRPFTLRGEIVRGDQRGRELGFPTANLLLHDYVRPRFGVYAVRVTHEETRYDGVANIGTRPTFEGLQERCEVHIFRAPQVSLYGAILDVELIEFLRPEQRFESLDALKARIAEDCLRAHHSLASPIV